MDGKCRSYHESLVRSWNREALNESSGNGQPQAISPGAPSAEVFSGQRPGRCELRYVPVRHRLALALSVLNYGRWAYVRVQRSPRRTANDWEWLEWPKNRERRAANQLAAEHSLRRLAFDLHPQQLKTASCEILIGTCCASVIDP